MKYENLELAVILAKKCFFEQVSFSTSELASVTGFSQQSISRKLRELESDGIILRVASNVGTKISFTDFGRKEIEKFYFELKDIFSKNKITLKGKVVEGAGEGKYYTSLPQYKKIFKSVFGIEIYPGTLNIEVNSAKKRIFISQPPIRIDGFRTKDRSFGAIDCWPCKLNKTVSAIAILPLRTHHSENIIEIIADSNLREKMKLTNGSKVEITKE